VLHATAHLIPLDLINQTIFVEEYNNAVSPIACFKNTILFGFLGRKLRGN
jgi:hypothetical protein